MTGKQHLNCLKQYLAKYCILTKYRAAYGIILMLAAFLPVNIMMTTHTPFKLGNITITPFITCYYLGTISFTAGIDVVGRNRKT